MANENPIDSNAPDESQPDNAESLQIESKDDQDVVEAPELLLRAEARVSGRSVRQWRRMLRLGSQRDAPWIGIALLVAVVAIWIWITYNR